jgi:DNA adenine methylase
VTEPLKACFPAFGGKGRVAHIAWRGIGHDIPNVIEPFAFSAAFTLARPGGPGKIETLNDINSFCMNFWRAVTWAPEEVARWCDFPVSECDMHATHKWLIDRLPEHRERMQLEPEYFDARIAGYWVHGACSWIGSGWGAERNNGKHPRLDGIGKGIHADQGHPPRWPLHLSGEMGIHRLPSLGNDRGLHGVAAPPALEWFRRLQTRLRRVRFACGDFERVLSPSILGKGKNVGGRRPCGVFFDAPYPHDGRSVRLYNDDDPEVWFRAQRWAIEHGDDPELRIVVCGYEGPSFPDNWTVYEWEGARGYAGEDNDNRTKERMWFSPHCLPLGSVASVQFDLFASKETA